MRNQTEYMWAYRGHVLWGCGAVITSVLFAFAALFAIQAGVFQLRLDRVLAADPVRLPVDLSRPGAHAADWQTPYYGHEGLELELLVEPPLDDVPRDERMRSLRGTVTYEPTGGKVGSWSFGGGDFLDYPISVVPRDRHRSAFLLIGPEAGAKPGRLTLTVTEPAHDLAGHEQELVVRPMLDYNTAYPLRRLCWLAAIISGGMAALLMLLLVRARLRQRRAARSRHLG